ncbi:MAG: peptidoglycan DD-metalloendopeptidase family protein [Candidatus Aenigmarchaeota archaeon]|nr:peptidoglycan DD-metalloendopeptidase family protein [Candidatus Aenigmarchaeota archaeon]
MRNKKGAGTTIGAVLIVIVLLLFLYVFLSTALTASQKKLELNLNTADFLKVKNSVSIINRSLSTTWFVSTAQLLFKAGDESVGCGYDDYFTQGMEIIKKSYWYQYNDTSKSKETNPLPLSGKKYNIGTFNDLRYPRICYPTEQHFIEFLNEKSTVFKDILTKLQVNNIEFVLDKINIIFDVNSFENDKITSEASQEIRANLARNNPGIITITKNTNTIFTAFKKMLETGRNIVDNAFAESAKIDPRKDQRLTSQLLYTPADTETKYKERVNSHLIKIFSDAVPVDAKVKMHVNSVNTIQVRAGDESENGLEFSLSKQGLVLHYDNEIRIVEKSALGSIACVPIKQEFLERIRIEVMTRTWIWTDLDVWNRVSSNTIAYSEEEVVNLMSAMMQKESSQNVREVSDCGAAGLMQLMPGTAKSSPNAIPVIFGEASFTDCTDENGKIKQERIDYAKSLRAAINGKSDEEIKSIDGRLDPVQGIGRSAAYMNYLLSQFSDYSSDKEEVMKLAVAAYNTGEYAVRAAIDKTKNIPGFNVEEVQYDQIKWFLSSETRNHVEIVMQLFACYEGGGVAPNPIYDWPTNPDTRRITSCFGRRNDPTTGEEGQFHKGIDIANAKGTAVLAVADGTAIQVNTGCTEGTRECGGGYGNFVKIDHGNYFSFYAHLKEGSIDTGMVNVGNTVTKGQKIAEMGKTGKATGPNIHFEVRRPDDSRLNPCNFIDCSQSTGDKCRGDIDTTLLEGLYYYHDEQKNTFTPRPFSLEMKVEDYLNVLDCVQDVPQADIYKLYVWNSQNDMVCCGGSLWTCSASPEVPNLGDHALQEGENIDKNRGQQGELCAEKVNERAPRVGADDIRTFTLGCTASGFDVVAVF